MFGQAVKVMFRQVMRQPFIPILNVVGLALGITVTLLIFLYAHIEMSYDDWVLDQRDLYRIEGQYKGEWSAEYHPYAVNALGPAIREFPEIESVVRIVGYNWLVKRGDFVNYELIYIAEAGFLDMFPLQFVAGDHETVFQTQSNIIISQDTALQYFGEADPVGQTLTINGTSDYIVAGIFRNVEERTDYPFKFIVPFQESMVYEANSWNVYDSETFVRLKPDASTDDLYERIAQLVDEHRPLHQQTDHVMRERFHYFLQAFGDLHLGSSGRTGTNSIGNFAKIYGFIAIATLVLIVSVFNYISLATARALEREREFCLRKISGAGFRQILGQTVAEAFLLTSTAACLAWALSEVLMLYARSFFAAEYSLVDLMGVEGGFVFVSAILALSLAAGLYPAVMIRGFRPVRFLSGSRTNRAGANRLRTVLVFLQFSICIGLVIGAVTISRQMAYINQLDLGYNPEGLVAVYGLDKAEVAPTSDTFKDRLSRISGVEAVTRSRVIPLASSYWWNVFYSENTSSEATVNLRMVATDYDFIDTYGAKLIAGRRLNSQYSEDTIDMFDDALVEALQGTRNVIVNKEALGPLGYASAEGIIGKEIFIKIKDSAKPLVVVGVIEGMRFYSARSGVEPKIHFHAPGRYRAASVRVDTSRTQEVLGNIQMLWAEMFPEVPFQRYFLEDLIKRDYEGERNQQLLFIVFSCLAIVLSLVGLVGLVSNSITHRAKEMSVRRVLGASLGDNVRLLTWQYVKPVLWANIPAWIVAYYFLTGWLEKYSQRIDVGLQYYLLGGGVIILITATMTVGLVIRAALIRPADILKCE